jgi:N-carbamoylputrescine amidase
VAENQTVTIRVAAVQMESQNGDIKRNLAHATVFVEEAARKGARLIALPELMPTGYILTKEIWNAAEESNGFTVQWLKKNAARLGVFLGTSFLEADGDDFFNTFVMTDPDGQVAGRVRKQTPASLEGSFFKGEDGSHVINTGLGKIGVGICYENWLSYLPRLMHRHSVDIMLMPHSAPTSAGNRFLKAEFDRYNNVMRSFPVYYSRLLGIPVILINKCGPGPLIKPPFFSQETSFPGLSAIADSDGSLKVQMGDEEGVIVEDIVINPARKTKTLPLRKGRWAVDVSLAQNIAPLTDAIPGIFYKFSAERKRRAREISAGKA